MKVYVVIYEYGLGAKVHKVFNEKAKALLEVKKMNGTGERHGTYSYTEKDLE